MKQAWASLKGLSREQLVEEFDRVSERVDVWSAAFIREEIFRRDAADQGDRMEQMTREMRNLTRWIAGLTVVIAILTVILVCAERA